MKVDDRRLKEAPRSLRGIVSFILILRALNLLFLILRHLILAFGTFFVRSFCHDSIRILKEEMKNNN